MFRFHHISSLALAVSLLASSTLAAEPALDLSEASAVVLAHEEHVTVGTDGLKQTRTLRRIKILQDEAIEYVGDVQVPYNAHYERATLLRAETTTPDGRKTSVQTNLVVDMLPQSQGGYREYSDNRHLSFSMPALCKGAILEYETEVAQTIPVISNAFWASSLLQELFTPVQSALYTVTTPAGSPCVFTSTPSVRLVGIVTNGTTVTRTWTATNLPAVRIEYGMPNLHELLESVRVSSLTNWETVVEWYRGLLDERGKCDQAMQDKATQVAGSAKTPMEKAIALVDFVQSSVRYVAIELGEGAYQPRPATQCFANLYGDCKDKALLLTAMLKSVGVAAEVALVSATRDGQFDREIPSPEQFNHVVVWLPELNLWVDPTVQYLGAFVHPESLDDVPALIVSTRAGVSGFKTIPCAPASLDTAETILDIDAMPDGMHHLRKTIRGSGRAAARMRSRFASMTPDERQKNATQYAEREPGYRRLRNWQIDGLDARTNTFALTIDIDAEGFLTPTAMGFGMELDAAGFSEDVALPEPADKKRGRLYDWVRRNNTRATIECNVLMPVGYRAGGRLENGLWSTVNGQIRFSGTNAGTRIRARLDVEAIPARIARANFNTTRRDIDRLLSRIKRSVELVDSVDELLTQFKPSAARALLDELGVKHPDDAFLPWRKGAILSACGYLHGARQSYQAALAKDPSRQRFYGALALTYSGTVGIPGKGYNAAATTECLSRGKDKVIDAAGLQMALVEALASDARGRSPTRSKDLPKAIELAKTATETYPDDPRTWLWYGDCLLQSNDCRAAHAAFSRAVELAPATLGGHIGQWRAAALDGDTEACIRAVKTVYPDLQSQVLELVHVTQLLLANRRFDDARQLADAIAAVAGNSEQARALVHEFEDVTEASLRDYRTFRDLKTPRQTALTYMSAFMFTDDAKLEKILSKLVYLPTVPFLDSMDSESVQAMTDETRNIGLASLMVDRNVEEVSIAEGLTLVKIRRAASGEALSGHSIGVLCRKEGEEWRVVDASLVAGMTTTFGLALENTIREGNIPLRNALVAYYTQHVNSGGRLSASFGCPFLAHPFTDPANQAKAIMAYCLRLLPGNDGARRAIPHYEALSAAEPTNRAIWRELAGTRIRFMELTSAAAAVARAVATDPDDPQLQMMQTGVLLMCGRIADAETALKAVEAKLGSQPNVRDLRIRFLLQAERFKDALALVDNGAQQGAHAVPGRVEQDLFIAMGLQDRIARIEEQLAVETFNPLAHFNLYTSYYAMGQMAKAQERLEILLLRDRANVTALKELCRCMILAGNLDEADCLLAQIVQLLPNEAARGDIDRAVLVGRGRYQEAAKLSLNRQKALGEDIFSYLHAGCCYLMAGDKTAATECLRKVAKVESPDHNASRYARMLLGEQDPDALLATIKACPDYLRRQDWLCEFYYYRGLAAQTKGDKPTAVKMYTASRDTRASQNVEHFMSSLALQQLKK